MAEDQILQKLTGLSCVVILTQSTSLMYLITVYLHSVGTFIDIVMTGVSTNVPFHRAAGHERRRVHYHLRIRKLFCNKTKCWRLYKAFPTANLYDKFKRPSKVCSRAVKDYHLSIEEKLVENGNLGSFYKYVNKNINGSSGIAPLRDEKSICTYCQQREG